MLGRMGARGGFGYLGLVGAGGAILNLSGNSVAATASIGTVIGSLAVIGGKGVYTFSLTSNPGGLFSISGSNLQVAAALTAGTDPITIQANNGAGSIINRSFAIVVTGAGSAHPTFFILGF